MGQAQFPPLRIGIVGSEGAKFTPKTEAIARGTIKRIIDDRCPPNGPGVHIVSGGCHLGGIDKWAVEEAQRGGHAYTEHYPVCLSWSGGYKPRNILIARDSDIVYCLTVKEFPSSYRGMRFPFCYHCKTDEHIKSGGCWTAHYAAKLGKTARIIVISEYYEPKLSEIS